MLNGAEFNQPNSEIVSPTPNKLTITNNGEKRVQSVLPVTKEVINREGKSLGRTVEFNFETTPGDNIITVDFRIPLDPNKNYNVISEGWNTWSQYKHSIKSIMPNDQTIGLGSLKDSLERKPVIFWEPKHVVDTKTQEEGTSYGWVCFRNDLSEDESPSGGEDIMVGVIPGLDAIETIRYKMDEEGFLVVSIDKNMEAINSPRKTKIKVFLGHASQKEANQQNRTVKYADLVSAYGEELAKLKEDLPLMENQVLGFSYVTHSAGVTEEKVKQEVDAGKGMYTGYVIDGGWEKRAGSFEINKDKFPNMEELVKHMKLQGITPGIWTIPFYIEEPAQNIPRDWFMKDENNKPLRYPFPLPKSSEHALMPLQKPYALDISNPEVRAYLVNKFVELAKTGFEIFKVDFLSAPFIGNLQNKDKTSVEYYRQVFTEIKDGIKQTLGEDVAKKVQFIGCGAPMMESIGLFNGARISPDSALPNLENISMYGKLLKLLNLPIVKKIKDKVTGNMDMALYRNAASTAARRILPYKNVYGLFLDGLHLNDPKIPMIPVKKAQTNASLIALAGLGLSNMFVGDSMVGRTEEERNEWKNFIGYFKSHDWKGFLSHSIRGSVHS